MSASFPFLAEVLGEGDRIDRRQKRERGAHLHGDGRRPELVSEKVRSAALRRIVLPTNFGPAARFAHPGLRIAPRPEAQDGLGCARRLGPDTLQSAESLNFQAFAWTQTGQSSTLPLHLSRIPM